MSAVYEESNCGFCNVLIKNSDDALLCEGFCEAWYHIKCVDISASVYKKLKDIKDDFVWYCYACRSKVSSLMTKPVAADEIVCRPHERTIDVVNARFKQGDAVYKHPVMPGYEGFVPRINNQFGQRYSVLATEALSEFQEQEMKNKLAQLQVAKMTRLQANTYAPTTSSDRQMVQSEFKLPLLEVRPQSCGILRNLPVNEPETPPAYPGHIPSPYFMDCLDPEKKFISGYAGHIPFGYSKYGEGYGPHTNSSLCDFTSNYRNRESTEWAPLTVVKPDPPLMIQSSELYHKNIGMLPNYQGHIPGAMFRFGKTFGKDSIDAKRWLRGDFAT